MRWYTRTANQAYTASEHADQEYEQREVHSVMPQMTLYLQILCTQSLPEFADLGSTLSSSSFGLRIGRRLCSRDSYDIGCSDSRSSVRRRDSASNHDR